MHAVFVEVDVEDGFPLDEARKHLQENAPSMAREAGARSASGSPRKAAAACR